jgi:hypothetical protein
MALPAAKLMTTQDLTFDIIKSFYYRAVAIERIQTHKPFISSPALQVLFPWSSVNVAKKRSVTSEPCGRWEFARPKQIAHLWRRPRTI